MQNTNTAVKTKSHAIPADVLMDALQILLDSDIPFHIESINEQEHTVLILAKAAPDLPPHRKAMENLKTILEDYAYYRHGAENTLDLSEA